MAKDKYNPEAEEPRQAAEGEATVEDREAAATDPSADPLAEAERILADAPDESFEVPQAHEQPAGEEGDEDLSLDADAPVVEDPELREVHLDEASDYDREAELENDLRRVQAEYVNYRRRVERDRSVEKERVKGQLISELMPVLDDIAAARQAGDLEDGPFAHIAGRLEQILTHEGLTAVGAVGEEFDPNEHEAIMQQPHQEIEADRVAIVVRAGYRFNDRLLRAAQVIVSAGPE